MNNAPVVAVASGKGGVGKSTVVANLAVAMARLGRKVLVLDADFSLANIDVLLGLAPRHTIQHFFTGDCSLEDLIVEGPSGIRIIPAASGIPDLTRIDRPRREALLSSLESLRAAHDYLLVDAPAGIGDNVVHLCSAANRTVVVVSPEPTSLVDAYATIKVLAAAGGIERLGIVVNNSRSSEETSAIHGQIGRVCEQFLGSGIELVGEIVHDDNVRQAVVDQEAIAESMPSSPAARCFFRLAVEMEKKIRPVDGERGPLFWDRLLDGSAESTVH